VFTERNVVLIQQSVKRRNETEPGDEADRIRDPLVGCPGGAEEVEPAQGDRAASTRQFSTATTTKSFGRIRQRGEP